MQTPNAKLYFEILNLQKLLAVISVDLLPTPNFVTRLNNRHPEHSVVSNL